jgi:hypothetical protein
MRRFALVVASGLLLVSCAVSSPSIDKPDEPPQEPGLGEIRYSCGGPPGFLPSLLDQEPTAELESHPSAEALRATIAQDDLETDILPESGYWLASRDASSAQYIARSPGGGGGAGEPEFVEATFNNEGATWTLAGWGQCQPTIVLDGLSLATWALDPDVPPPDASATSFAAVVTERACTGAQPMLGRLLPPSISYDAESISLVFAARPLAGNVFTCPGNPSTRVTVELREPLGARRLLDAGLFPPRDASLPPA